MKKLLSLCAILLFLAGCDKNKDYLIIIHTEYGDMKAILYDQTPLHKKNFIELAKAGRYDSTKWHRVVENFMIQGGDVQTKEGIRETEADRIPAEIVDGFYHTKGAIAAARQGDNVNPEKMSSSSQFYIVDGNSYTESQLTTDQAKLNQALGTMLRDPKYDSLRNMFVELQKKRDMQGMNDLALKCKEYVEQEMNLTFDKEDVDLEMVERYTNSDGAPHLDNQYTVFGRVVEGLEVIDKIAAVKKRGEKPVKDTYLTIELEEVSKKKITKEYGYEYPNQEK